MKNEEEKKENDATKNDKSTINLSEKYKLQPEKMVLDQPCMFCYSRPKDAGLTHGRLTHQICCYPCAKKIWQQKGQCPICRRKIERITKIIAA